MFELTGDTILAGAREAARRQGIGTDGVSDKDRMAAIGVLDAAAEEGPEALAAAEAGIDPAVLASLAHLDVPRSEPATIGLPQLDTPFVVQALNCYRQPIGLPGQLHADGLHVVGSEALSQALTAKTGLFDTENRGQERHRTWEFVVTGPEGTVHYRRTRGGLERVEAPPVTV